VNQLRPPRKSIDESFIAQRSGSPCSELSTTFEEKHFEDDEGADGLNDSRNQFPPQIPVATNSLAIPTAPSLGISLGLKLKLSINCDEINRQSNQHPITIKSIPETDIIIDENREEEYGNMPRVSTFVGTATFMSPERIDGGSYSYPSDIWAFGLSIMSVAIGRVPFENQGGYWGLVRCIRDGQPPTLPEDEGFSIEFQDFLSCCLKHDPLERFSASKLLHHDFLRKSELYEENDETNTAMSISEVEDIISALFLHISHLKSNSVNPTYKRSETEQTEFDLFFGDIGEDISIILKRVVLGIFTTSKPSTSRVVPSFEIQNPHEFHTHPCQRISEVSTPSSCVERTITVSADEIDLKVPKSNGSTPLQTPSETPALTPANRDASSRHTIESTSKFGIDRLKSLSYQLGLAPDQVMNHVVSFCSKLKSNGVDEEFISTPRAAHDKKY
jgi:serine/threonine protein kinase